MNALEFRLWLGDVVERHLNHVGFCTAVDGHNFASQLVYPTLQKS